jgi:hypothetical protein
MTVGLDDAASAFAAEINPTAPARKSSNSIQETKSAPERIFADPEETEDFDDESQGDHDDDSGSAKEPAPKRGKPTKNEDADPDEDEGEDEDGEEDSEDDEEESDADEDEGEPVPLDFDTIVQVTVDGKAAEVSLKEAVNGYIRQETFHQRLNQLQEVKNTLDKQHGEIDSMRAAYLTKLDALDKQLKLIEPQEPDWDAEYAANAGEARAKQKAWDLYKLQRAEMDKDRNKAVEEHKARAKTEFDNWVVSERHQMLKDNPGWNDQKVAHRDLSSMRRTAREAGYSDAEIDTLYDSRQARILLKASKYDRIMAKKPKPVDTKPSTNGSGSSSMRTVPKGVNKAAQRLRKTGSLSDAKNVFLDIINR